MICRSKCVRKYFDRTIFIQTYYTPINPPPSPPPPLPPQSFLTHQLVQSTLTNSPSDLISLSFFIWSARQNNFFHSIPTFHHMVSVLSRLTCRFGSVHQILLNLSTFGFRVNPQILLLLLRIYWYAEMYPSVFHTFHLMLHHGYTPHTYARNIIIDVFFKTGRVSVALRVFKDTPAPNFFTFSIAICNLCRIGDSINLLRVLKDMLRNGYYPNADTFSVVLSCLCKMGRLVEALQLYGMMITLGIPLSVKTWSILIDGFCKFGKLDVAVYLLEKMVKTGYSPNVVTCTSLVKGFMELEMPDTAFDVLRSLVSKGNSPDLVLYNVLIDCLAKLGRHDDALDVFVNLLSTSKLIPDSYTFCSLITLACLSRQFTLLPALIRGLPVQADLVVCNSILSYYCKAGYPSGAVEFYKDMIDRGIVPDRYSFAGLLRGLCGAGKINEAVNVYRGIVMSNVGLDAHVHTIIVDGLIRSGQFHRAIRLFREAATNNYPLDVVSYTVAINGLFRAGRSQEAYTLFCQMKEDGIAPNSKTYNVMLIGFLSERDSGKVEQILQEMLEARIKLDCYAFNRVKSLLFKLHRLHSIVNLLFKFQDNGLIPENVLKDLIDGLAPVLDDANAYLSLVDGDVVDHLDARGTYSSEELFDLSASVA